MTPETESLLAKIMHSADPNPAAIHQPLTLAQLALRDHIMSEAPQMHLATSARVAKVARWAAASLRRGTAAVTAVGATAAVIVVVALSMSTVPTLVAGTSAPTVAAPSPLTGSADLAKAWEFARERATSTFERDVLADGQVTLDEYREAQRLFTPASRTPA